MADRREIDEATQTETTGHEWDGIKELDTPMPRWWLWTFYATVVWGVIYVILMPSWPLVTRATPGLLGYNSRESLATELAAAEAVNAPLNARLMQASLADVQADPDLMRFATAGGAAVFRNYCSQCHGAGAGGAVGYPNLLDDDWLWGGTVEEIVQTVTHGIRYEADPDTRFSQMPAFGDILTGEEIDALVEYVRGLGGLDHDASAAETAAELFATNCAACHGPDGTGDRSQGAPDMSDGIWLYGSDSEALHDIIARGPYGIMPAFGNRLAPADIRKVAVYAHGLGGGE